MKKTSVILIVVLIAIVIVGAVGIMPIAIFSSASNFYSQNINDSSSVYQANLAKITNNEFLSDNVKNSINAMDKTVSEVFLKTRISYFWVSAYLILSIAVILIVLGIFFIKSDSCKNYVGTSLIVAACMLLAFTSIIGFALYK